MTNQSCYYSVFLGMELRVAKFLHKNPSRARNDCARERECEESENNGAPSFDRINMQFSGECR